MLRGPQTAEYTTAYVANFGPTDGVDGAGSCPFCRGGTSAPPRNEAAQEGPGQCGGAGETTSSSGEWGRVAMKVGTGTDTEAETAARVRAG